jgi:uncharacterized protein YunC (DUF1805 family)
LVTHSGATVSDQLPRSTSRPLPFDNGTAIGIGNRWERGQYCSILTRAGIVGCGIYDLETAAEFGQAIAIARGTPAKPLVEPEDLLEARIVGVTPQAEALGITAGMTGREAVERMLRATTAADPPSCGRLR